MSEVTRDERRKLLEEALLGGQDETQQRLDDERWKRLFAELSSWAVTGLFVAHMAFVHGCGQ